MLKYSRWCLGVALAFCIGDAGAVSFGTFDPRSLGMGGTGVADGRAGDAAYYNPALLATQRASDDFSVDAPVAGAILADPDKLRDGVNTFQNNDNTTKFSNDITTFQNNPTQANADQAIATGQALLSDLQGLSDKALLLEANVGLSIAVPSRKLGVGVIVDGRALGGAELNVTANDINSINDALDKLKTLDPTVTDVTQNFNSSVPIRAAVLAEAGVALAHDFTILGRDVSFGVTPKFVRVDTFDYDPTVQNASVTLSQGHLTDNTINLDLGAAAHITDALKAGFVIKNIIPHDFTTALGHVISSNPQARAGVAYERKLYTLAMDIDLTNNDPTGLDAATQYLALGGEVDAWGWAQLRAGYRYNMQDNNTSAASVGVGISPFGVHIDVAVIASSKLLGLAAQTGFRF